MFQLSIIKVCPTRAHTSCSRSKLDRGTQDTVAVHPAQFGLPPTHAITNELNKKYANRVLHDVGLCVCIFDLAEVGEGKVRYGDGFLWYKGASPIV